VSHHRRTGAFLGAALLSLAAVAATGRGTADDSRIGLPAEDTEQSRQERIVALGLDDVAMRFAGCAMHHTGMLYHDCQQAVSTDGQAYGAMLLAAIDPDLFFVTDATFDALAPNRVIRVGSLSNMAGQPFQFGPNFQIAAGTTHCLYLGRSGPPAQRWNAMFVDCTQDPADPATRVIDWNNAWSSIHVERVTAASVPTTATLDWDNRPGIQRQVMGIRCGSAWCTIAGWGPPSLRPIPNAGAAANRQVRGWHDQQVLALPDGPGRLRPGSAVATLMAEPDIEALREADFSTPRLVARAHFTNTDTVYLRKFNLDATGSGENEIRIAQEGSVWVAYIRSASGRTAKFNVSRQPDPTTPMSWLRDPPGSARWGWLPDDENIWVRCGGACCEITSPLEG
jgi:hypothetical protein